MKYCDKCGQEIVLKVNGFYNSLKFEEYYECKTCGFKKYLCYEENLENEEE